MLKQCGRAPLGGLHTYRIDTDGVTVVPRLEAVPLGPARSLPAGRAPFSLAELDDLCAGGPAVGSITVLAGVVGADKTMLALHSALAGVAAGESTIFVSLREDLDQLRDEAAGLGHDLDAAMKLSTLTVIPIVAVEHDPDVIMSRVLAAVRDHDAR